MSFQIILRHPLDVMGSAVEYCILSSHIFLHWLDPILPMFAYWQEIDQIFYEAGLVKWLDQCPLVAVIWNYLGYLTSTDIETISNVTILEVNEYRVQEPN